MKHDLKLNNDDDNVNVDVDNDNDAEVKPYKSLVTLKKMESSNHSRSNKSALAHNLVSSGSLSKNYHNFANTVSKHGLVVF